jgi:hypothetical protein
LADEEEPIAPLDFVWPAHRSRVKQGTVEAAEKIQRQRFLQRTSLPGILLRVLPCRHY